MVLDILKEAFSGSLRFSAVFVVDSEGDGSIPSEVRNRDWPVIYYNGETNLGAAGNHFRRLELAAGQGLEWCYFLNHDGHLDFENVHRMLETAAKSQDKVGAVYPLLYNDTRARPWEDGRTSFLPSAQNLSTSRPAGRENQVLWGSSNGALYSLAPYRAGLRIRTEVWHGYEDLGYGALLYDHGWKQLVCRDAVLRNAYDYKPVKLFGQTLHITDKPAWYAYYGIRNLILIQRRRRFSPAFFLMIGRKTVRETGLVILLREEKLRRLYLLYLGLLHGLIGRGGKWKLP